MKSWGWHCTRKRTEESDDLEFRTGSKQKKELNVNMAGNNVRGEWVLVEQWGGVTVYRRVGNFELGIFEITKKGEVSSFPS